MTNVTTCPGCGYRFLEPVPGAICPECGGKTGTSAVFHAGRATAVARAGPVTFRVSSHFARSWYEDALGEVRNERSNDLHARRREIVFAVCCAESYLYEWTSDLGVPDLDRYFPPKPSEGWNRSVTDQWKEVPKLLHADGWLPARPDFGGPNGTAWLRLEECRNGLVHALVSRPEVHGEGPTIRPVVTGGDLAGMEPGWAVAVVAERIRRLHGAAGTPPPEWLTEP